MIIKGKEVSGKQKAVIISAITVIVVAVVVAAILVGLYFGGVLGAKEGAMLRTKDASNGYKKHYVEGEGTLPGIYAKITFNDGTDDYKIAVLLMEDYAPITVNNFIVYAEEGFYEGTVIHRIEKDTYTFQGGGYTYDETNGYVEKKATHDAINGEFSSNPTGDYSYNKLSHFAGTISMARSSNKNSATSQFFFSWQNYSGWDGDYAAFGFIVDNEDLAKIKTLGEETKTDSNGYPKKNNIITITKVEIEEIK